jgi:hypothetical protein
MHYVVNMLGDACHAPDAKVALELMEEEVWHGSRERI